MDITAIKKNKFTEAVKGIGNKLYEVFKDYPVTLAAIILASLFGAIIIGLDNTKIKEALEKMAYCFMFASAQHIFYEEVFKKKWSVRICGYAASAAISIFMVYYIINCKADCLFGTDTDTVIEIATRIFFVYLMALDAVTVWHMYRRLEEDFEEYCTKAFLGIIKATVVYSLFAIGLALIVWIIDELLFNTHDFMGQIELFLAGGIYVPMCLRAISAKGEKPGRFAKLCVVYVLQSMLLIAFAVIYIYIIKIFVTDTVPSNQVFNILAWLFALGMPIWTMVHGINEEDGFLYKAAVYVPYAFIPFICLQCWSMGIRIRDYGFTVSRYLAVVLITGEILYFVLYAFCHRGNKRAISYILFALIAFSAFGLIIPGTSYDDVIIRSQAKRLTEMIDKNDESLQKAVKSAYSEIMNVSYKGPDAIDKILSGSQKETIENYDLGYNDYRNEVYLSYYGDLNNVDISGYDTISEVNGSEEVDIKNSVVKVITGERYGNEAVIEVDLSEVTAWAMENYNKRNSDDFTLEGRETLRIDDKRDLYITSFYMDYYQDSKEISSLSVSGYILEHK